MNKVAGNETVSHVKYAHLRKLIKVFIFLYFRFQINLRLYICLTGRQVGAADAQSGPEVIKLFFMFSSADHEILNAHKYKNRRKFSTF